MSIIPPVNPQPCPSCGHCPTCGRPGHLVQPWPTYPTWQVWNTAGTNNLPINPDCGHQYGSISYMVNP